ncbi:unannotated protein [freshwater metagenome]|uniref:Unannotated protein n=1 Tax=freshwater metagenome TaxID=449393 RepID=A0A6J6V8R4_9ZZZZ
MGPCTCRSRVGCKFGYARPRSFRQSNCQLDRRGKSDGGCWRTNYLDGSVARVEGQRHFGIARNSVRRFRSSQSVERGISRANRPAHFAGVGHDRNQPDRCRLHVVGSRSVVASNRTGRVTNHCWSNCFWCRCASCRARHNHSGCMGRRNKWRVAVQWQLDCVNVLQRCTGRRKFHRGWLASHGRRCNGGREGSHPACRPHEGSH